MIIHLHFDNVPLNSIQIEYIIKCVIVGLSKIVFITLVMKASLVVLRTLKWTYTQIDEYNLENICLKDNANSK